MGCNQAIFGRFDVEISGWDQEEDFYVEDSWAEWHDSGRKVAYVRHPVRPGNVLFVRLLDWRENKHSFPVAYRAGYVSIPDRNGFRSVELEAFASHARKEDRESVTVSAI